MSSLVISLGILFTTVAATVSYAKKTEKNTNISAKESEENFKNTKSNDFLDFSGGLFGI